MQVAVTLSVSRGLTPEPLDGIYVNCGGIISHVDPNTLFTCNFPVNAGQTKIISWEDDGSPNRAGAMGSYDIAISY